MGRKRKSGLREPSGRLSRAERNDGPAPVVVARIRAGLLQQAADPALGTAYGVMYLRGEIAQDQYDAAGALAQARADYLRAIGARTLRSAALEPSAAGAGGDPESAAGQVAAERDRASVARYTRFAGLLGELGPETERAVWLLVEGGATWAEREIAKRGLERVGRWLRTGR